MVGRTQQRIVAGVNLPRRCRNEFRYTEQNSACIDCPARFHVRQQETPVIGRLRAMVLQ
jgi:hypothetical protein